MDLHDPIHKKVIGVSFIVFSVFSLVGVYFYDIFMEWVLEQANQDPDFDTEVGWIFAFIDSIVWALAIIFLVPRLILGIALTLGKKWANIPSMVFGIISMLNFPIGTALGVYCILVFTAKPRPEETFDKRDH